MDYDDIDYDEGYSTIDIENNWSNSNMEYDEIDYDSNSEIDDYLMIIIIIVAQIIGVF